MKNFFYFGKTCWLEIDLDTRTLAKKSIINNLLYHLEPWLMLRKTWSGQDLWLASLSIDHGPRIWGK